MWVLLCLLALVAALTWRYLTSSFDYWQRKGVRSLANPKPLVGNMWTVMSMQEHLSTFFKRAYNELEGERFGGFFQGSTPTLFIRDPELIKHILVKDFSHFMDHGIKFHEEADPMQAKFLFNLEGQKWKEMRNKLTPTFTSARMKAMFPLMKECAKELEAFLLGLANSGEEFEVKDICSRYTTNVIGSCVFGICCDSLANPNNDFRKMGKKLVDVDTWRGIKLFILFFMPKVSMWLRLAVIEKEITNFFRKAMTDIIDTRKRTNKTRNDFIQLLIELKEKGQLTPIEDERQEDLNDTSSSLMNLTDDDLVAQAMLFFLAGFETSSVTLSFMLLELAVHTDLQRRLQHEIDEVLQRHDGKITYQALHEFRYMDCVLQETLRKYQPNMNIVRVCTKNYIIPGTDVTLEVGTPVIIPSHTVSNDPKYFPDPERFNPERFSNDETSQKNKFAHLPFGEGPRQCIGNRFALMQIKLGILAVLCKYDIHLCSRTNYPVVFKPQDLFLNNFGGIWIRTTLRSEE